ncbi:MAG: DUF2721 domain-containing protein [Chitinophagaceae bacterium]
MIDISINTPALLFPAITLLMLAYTNRFLAIANRIRNLHEGYQQSATKTVALQQIKSLRARINLIRYMQAMGALSFLCCVLCMYAIYRVWIELANVIFAISLLTLLISIVLSIVEIWMSTKALELELSDIEELQKGNIFTDIFYSREQQEPPESGATK